MSSDEHLLRCYRDIELNPIRARSDSQPSDYVWSSYEANAQGSTDPLVSPHPQYLALDAEDTARQHRYREGSNRPSRRTKSTRSGDACSASTPSERIASDK